MSDQDDVTRKLDVLSKARQEIAANLECAGSQLAAIEERIEELTRRANKLSGLHSKLRSDKRSP